MTHHPVQLGAGLVIGLVASVLGACNFVNQNGVMGRGGPGCIVAIGGLLAFLGCLAKLVLC